MQNTERLRQLGIDPIVPLADVAVALGCTQNNVKLIAKKRPEDLQIVRVSARRAGVYRSVLDRFMERLRKAA